MVSPEASPSLAFEPNDPRALSRFADALRRRLWPPSLRSRRCSALASPAYDAVDAASARRERRVAPYFFFFAVVFFAVDFFAVVFLAADFVFVAAFFAMLTSWSEIGDTFAAQANRAEPQFDSYRTN